MKRKRLTISLFKQHRQLDINEKIHNIENIQLYISVFGQKKSQSNVELK